MHKTALEKYFAQCYIDANIKECKLDLTTPEKWEAFLNYADKGRLIGSKIKNGTIYQFLTNQLRRSAETAKYNNGGYYKIYLINERAVWKDDQTLFGKALSINSQEVLILAPGLDDSTCAHELFHALGLYHSFSSLNSHTFEKNKTDNIMDYSDTLEGEKKIPVISTWQYQWKILHKNLKTVAQVKKEKEQKLKQQKLRQQEKRRK